MGRDSNFAGVCSACFLCGEAGMTRKEEGLFILMGIMLTSVSIAVSLGIWAVIAILLVFAFLILLVGLLA